MSVCQLNNKFTLILQNKEKVIQVKICKPVAKTQELCNILVSRTDASLVHASNNKLLAIGGQCTKTRAILDSIEVYDLILKIWQRCDLRMSNPLRSMTAASLPEGVIVMGGIDEQNKARNDCFKIIGVNSIKKLSPMPLNLPKPTCVVATAF